MVSEGNLHDRRSIGIIQKTLMAQRLSRLGEKKGNSGRVGEIAFNNVLVIAFTLCIIGGSSLLH